MLSPYEILKRSAYKTNPESSITPEPLAWNKLRFLLWYGCGISIK